MQLNTDATQRIVDSGISGENIVRMFAVMAEGVNVMGAAASQLMLDYQRPGDDAAEEDLFPVIILALRPAEQSEQRQHYEAMNGEVQQGAEQVVSGSVQDEDAALG